MRGINGQRKSTERSKLTITVIAMQLSSFPFSITDFSEVEPEMHQGITGNAEWRTITRDDIRIRLVKYSENYLADHWCSKGHIIYCVEGEMTTELEDGKTFVLQKGMIYTVGDNSDAHRSFSEKGCTLFIVD
jgi:quercetin dioxygenase-like cupin family protein